MIMLGPCLTTHLQTIPIGFVDNRRIVADDGFLWAQSHSAIDIFTPHWNVGADHSRCPQEMMDQALLPNLTLLVAMPEQRYLLFIEPGDYGLVTDPSQYILIDLAHDLC